MSVEDGQSQNEKKWDPNTDEAARLWGRYVDIQQKKENVAEKFRISWLVIGFALGFFVLMAGLAIVALG